MLHCDITVAHCKAQALGVAEQDFDLMLVDRQLPDGRGDEVIRALRTGDGQRNQYARAVLLTADVLAVDTDDWLNLAVDWVLTKPISFDECDNCYAGLSVGKQIRVTI
ncbi:MAG: hypothetical protein R3F37_05910 [Candidatus Competibacteraceae bacterium]